MAKSFLDKDGLNYLWDKITAKFLQKNGNAVSATKATQDSAGQQINTTYIKNASVSGKTITFTKGNGSTFAINTQDTNTTYANMKGATASAAGAAGLVPAPAAGAQGKFLRGDGTFADIPIDPNAFYRNKHLGTITADTVESFLTIHGVPTGEFKDIFVGDTVDIIGDTYNKTWVIAGIDHFWNVGTTAVTNHHLVLMPRSPLLYAGMNDTNTSAGGFKGSKMFTTILPQVNTNLETVLGNHLLTRKALISTHVDNNTASSGCAQYKGISDQWLYTECKAILATEVQIYGSMICSTSLFDVGEGCYQLPIFKFGKNHAKLFDREWFWLRAVANSQAFCFASGNGDASNDAANSILGVLPLICVG